LADARRFGHRARLSHRWTPMATDGHEPPLFLMPNEHKSSPTPPEHKGIGLGWRDLVFLVVIWAGWVWVCGCVGRSVSICGHPVHLC
jgi:hypothetical protein